MTAAALPSVRRVSIRVALLATAVVAAAYLAVCVGVIAIVQRNLTDQIDQRITSSFVRLDDDHGGHDENPYQAPPPERFGGAPVVVWAVDSSGQVHTDASNPVLPAEYRRVGAPLTATINGVDLRLAGRQVGDDWVVIGQSLEAVTETRQTVIVAELLIAPILLATVFQLAHVVEEAEFPMPDEQTGKMDTHWAVHQVQTTVDFARRNRVLSWLLGGLNFQVEHHLMSRICHVHYPALSKIVEEVCNEYGIRYNAHRTFWSALASHARWVRAMGKPTAVTE